MKFALTGQQLKDLYADLRPVSNKPDVSFDMLQNIVFIAENDKVTAIINNRMIAVTSVVDAEIEVEGSCCIQRTFFANIIPAVQSDLIYTFEMFEDFILSITSEVYGKILLKTVNPKGFPELPAPNDCFTISFKDGLFSVLLQKVIYAMNIDAGPYQFSGAHFIPEKDSIRILGTNGRHVVSVKHSGITISEKDTPRFMIAHDAIKHAAQIFKGSDEVRIGIHDVEGPGLTSFIMDKQRVVISRPTIRQSPDFVESLNYNSAEYNSILISRIATQSAMKFLIAASQSQKKGNSTEGIPAIPVMLEIEEGLLTLSSGDPHDRIIVSQSVLSYPDSDKKIESGRITLTAEYVQKALQHITSEMIRIEYILPNQEAVIEYRPVVLSPNHTDDLEHKVYIMPWAV